MTDAERDDWLGAETYPDATLREIAVRAAAYCTTRGYGERVECCYKAAETGYAAGKAAGVWIACSEQMPKLGDHILLAYPVGSKWSWCAGEVDGSDDGLFVDYELDGQEINTGCRWLPIILPPAPEREA